MAQKQKLKWACAAGALLFATPALAQQQPSDPDQPQPTAAEEHGEDEFAVEEAIVVTASQRWQELIQTPQPVTTFSAEDRNLMAANTARQLVDLTPGVQLSETYGLNVRGVGRQTPQTLLGQENTVTLYVDGFINLVPFNIAESTLFGGNVIFARGPQGTRYGRNALAGAVNLVSRAPTEEFTGQVVAGYGREGSYNAGFNLSGPLTENLGARFGIQTFHQPSFRDNIGAANGAGYAVDNVYYELQFDYDRGPLHFRSRTTHFDYDNQPDYVTPATYNTGPLFGALEPNPQYGYGVSPPTDSNTINVDFAGYDRLDDNLQQIINADWDFGGMTLYYVGGYQQYLATGSADRDGISRRSYDAATLAPGSFAPGTQVPTFYTSNYHNDNSFYSHELRLEGDDDDARLNWIVGLYHYSQDFDEHYWEAIPDSPELAAPAALAPGATTDPNPLLATFEQRNLLNIDSWAIFGNVNFEITDQLQLDAGLRYTSDDKSAQTNFRYIFSYPPFFAGDFTPLPHSASPAAEDEALTGHIDLIWRNPNSEFYASYARGYEASAFTLGQGLPPNNVSEPQFLDDYEVGMTFDFSPRLSLTGSLFHIEFEDMQVPISTRAVLGGLPVGPVFQTFVNAESAEIEGVEMELSWSPTDGSNFTFAYTALAPTFEDFCPPVIGSTPPVCGAIDITNQPAATQVPEDLSGNEIPRAPHNKASLYGYYTFNLGGAGYLIPGGSLTWQDEFYASAFTKERFLLPERTVANFSLTYRTLDSAWDVVAYVTNAFEEDAPDTVSVNVVGGATRQNFGRGPDRFYGVTVRRRF